MASNNSVVQSWRFFWIISAFLFLFTSLPFILNDYPGLADYANHLARLHLLTGHANGNWQQFYLVDHQLIANLALDTIGSYFVDLGLSVEDSLRLFAFITALVVIAGTYAIALALHKQPPWLVMWVFIFVFNRYYSWGFLNYFFSLGCGFLLLAFWILINKKPSSTVKYANMLLISILLIPLLISHLMGYGITLLCIFLYTLTYAISERENLIQLIKTLSLTSLMFLPSAWVYFFVLVHSGNGLDILYNEVLKSKVLAVLSPFGSYYSLLSLLFLASFILVLYIAMRNIFIQKLKIKAVVDQLLPNNIYLIPLAFLLLYLVLPSAMMGSAFLDKRLFVVVLLLLIATVKVKLDSKSASTIIAITLCTFIIKVYEVNKVWHLQTQAMNEISDAMNEVEMGSKVASYSFGDTKRMPIPPLQHAVSLAVFQRASFVPSIFAKPINLESIAFKDPNLDLVRNMGTYKYDYDQAKEVWTLFVDDCLRYDYVLVTYMTKRPTVPECYTKINNGEFFTLYKTNRS